MCQIDNLALRKASETWVLSTDILSMVVFCLLYLNIPNIKKKDTKH